MSMSSFVPSTDQAKEEEIKQEAAQQELSKEEKAKKNAEEIQNKIAESLKPAIEFSELAKAYNDVIKPAIQKKYSDKKDEKAEIKEGEELDKIPSWRKKQMAQIEATINTLAKAKVAEELKAQILLGLFAQIHNEIYKSYWNKFRVKNSVMYKSIDDVIKNVPSKAIKAAMSAYELFSDSPVYKQEVARVQEEQLQAVNLFNAQNKKGRSSSFAAIMKKEFDKTAKEKLGVKDPLAKDQLYKNNIEAIKVGSKDKEKTSYRDIEKLTHYGLEEPKSLVQYIGSFFKRTPAPAPEPKKEEKVENKHTHHRRRKH